MESARSARRRSMSYTRPGVPTTTCTPPCRRGASGGAVRRGRRGHVFMWLGVGAGQLRMHREQQAFACCFPCSTGRVPKPWRPPTPSTHKPDSQAAQQPKRASQPASGPAFCTHLQDAGVLAHGGAAHAGVALDGQVVAQGAHHLLNLLGQLAGGGQHQGLALNQGVVQVLQAGVATRMARRGARVYTVSTAQRCQ
jgi:hypothetical protein